MSSPYGIVRWTSSGFHSEYYGPNMVGGCFEWKSGEGQPPNALFYRSKEERDVALKDLCKSFPSVMFCPVEITQGFESPPGEIVGVSVSQKGILPL